jgi:hypothetical protein
MSKFTIGANASCSDGRCGKLTRLIVDPETQAVTHLVIDPMHRREPTRLVPIDRVGPAADEIRLRCTMAEFGKFDAAEEEDLMPSGPGAPR